MDELRALCDWAWRGLDLQPKDPRSVWGRILPKAEIRYFVVE